MDQAVLCAYCFKPRPSYDEAKACMKRHEDAMPLSSLLISRTAYFDKAATLPPSEYDAWVVKADAHNARLLKERT